jgi:aspartyl-tRNA(Asn)/glutamyl-tRNA(Gln) amidotransferase subunit A
LANSVACCAALDAVLARESSSEDRAMTASDGHGVVVNDLRLGVLSAYVTDGLEPVVATSFDRAVRALGAAGARLTDVDLPELNELPHANRNGGISSAEAFAHHRARLEKDAARYDPRVVIRILRGREQNAAEYIDLLKQRASFIERVSLRIRKFDAVLMPTTPITAPALSELAADEAYVRINALALRNSSIVNFLDGCAISIPCHEPGTAPVGLTLFGLRNTDRQVLAAAAAVEACCERLAPGLTRS